MSCRDIKTQDQYDKMLVLHYNKKEELVKNLTKSINLYKNGKNPTHKKAIERINKYQKIIDLANTQ